jgi:hypothetical protein
MSNRTEQLIQDALWLSDQNELCNQLSNLSLQLYERLIKAGYAKSDEEFREITNSFSNVYPKLSMNKWVLESVCGIVKPMSGIVYLRKDFLSSFKYATRWVELFDQFPRMIQSHPVFYLKANNFLLKLWF